MAIYANDLAHYDLKDIEEMLFELGKSKREDGEAALPDVGNLLERLRGIRRARYSRRAIDSINAELKHREEHPEEYIADAEIYDMEARLREKYEARFGAAKEVIIREPVSVVCPHCSGVLPLPANMRMWTSTEVRAFADLLDECERIAAKNREVA